MKSIKPSKINGRILAPPSKSMMQRALIAAMLAEDESVITNPSFCSDSEATIGVIGTLGAKVEYNEKKITIQGGGMPLGDILDCGESGTCLRIISIIAGLYDNEITVTGHGSLKSRPMHMIEEVLFEAGVVCKTADGKLPLTIKGPMIGGEMEVDGSESSQHISGLLMALPLCTEDSKLNVKNLKSKPYVKMTIELLRDFGVRINADNNLEKIEIKGKQRYKSRRYNIEGDWSGVSFLLVAGAIAGEARIRGLNMKSSQADIAILKALKKAGAIVRENQDSAIVEKNELIAFEFDATDCPDLFPPLAVLACNCKGKSIITGTERLKHKESDRAAVLVEELSAIGANIKVEGNQMIIEGNKLKGGTINSHNDHRIAMAGAIAALTCKGQVEITDEECISKSYPKFFDDLENMKVRE
ncbi:3-phosphoshikimate 1-carboxyvinyltransferase [Candidatus Micrarchaeota archaeon]|nr:3-phosphoshikimate 1-carboxyvinyltransferase [Candidatus Micrarchaeota archaeon]